MLNVLRENFRQAPYLKFVLLLVAAGLVLYLGSYFACEPGAIAEPDWAARVNGAAIPARRFLDTARTFDQYYRQMFGDNYEQIRPSLQIGRQALEGLIEREVVLQDARRLGLASTSEEIAEQIVRNPSFQDGAGQFIGTARYREVIERQVPGGVGAYERELADDLLAAKWSRLVTESVTVSEREIEDLFRQRTEKTSVDYAVLAPDERGVDPRIPAAELQRWYDARGEDYRRGAGWKIRFLVVEREAQRAKVRIEPAQVRQAYDANLERYRHPEQRRARHILFRIEPDATEADRQRAREAAERTLERIRAGEEFATLARELSQDPLSAERGGDLEFFARDQLAPTFEAAAFATPPGELAPVTESPFGFHVIQVTDTREAGVTPFQQVEETIRRSLELQAADALAASEATRLREEIGSAGRLQSVADAEGLAVSEVRTVFEGDSVEELGPSPRLVPALSATEAGGLTPPLPVAAGVALIAIDEVLAPAVPPLAEVQEQVERAIREERARQATLAAAERALARHATLRAAAAQLGAEPHAAENLAPGQGLPEAGGPAPEIEARLFGPAVAVGDRGAVPVPAGVLIFEVTGREAFDPTRFREERGALEQELLQERRDSYRESVIDRLRAAQRIEVNEPVVSQLRL